MPDPTEGSRTFSPGADRFFESVRPYSGDGTLRFPRELKGLDSTRDEREPLHTWFRRLVDGLGPQAPDSLAVEANMGLLATVRWTTGPRLAYANIQVLITLGSLEGFYCDDSQPAFYLRLDCDETTLGEPFSHPHPHIHLDGSLSPRFALDGGTSGNVVVDFIEFLYRHYHPDAWIAWADRIWQRDRSRRSIEPDDDPLPRIIRAFRANRLDDLRSDASNLIRLKRLLAEAKARMSPLRLAPADRALLEYPSAR